MNGKTKNVLFAAYYYIYLKKLIDLNKLKTCELLM